MPNWVSNNVSISGKKADLLAFAEKASKPHTEYWPSYSTNPDGTRKQNEVIEPKESEENALSFWNFVAPPEEDLPYYYGHKVKDEDKEDPNATEAEIVARIFRSEGSDAISWNSREWGTKWNSCNTEPYHNLDALAEGDDLNYRFDTAWSIPTPVFEAMVQQHPELSFDFYCEEEQGWGSEFTSSDVEEGEERSLIETDSWGIPESHADYAKRDNQDSCRCAWQDEPDDWYTDCPGRDKDFLVTITKTYRVKALNAENAWNLANDNHQNADDLMIPIEDENQIRVVDESGNKLFPNLSDLDLTMD